MKPRQRKPKVAKHVDQEQKRKRMVIGFGVVMIVLMVASILGVANYAPSGDQMEYGDYEFVLEDRPGGGRVLVTQINNFDVEFQNLPIQVGHLEVDPAAITLMQYGQQIALTADPNETTQNLGLIDYARLQLGLALLKTANAVLHEHPDYTLPVLNCSHASPQMPVVVFNITNGTGSLTTDGHCIFVNGRDQELMRLKDRIIFEYHGILQNGAVA